MFIKGYHVPRTLLEDNFMGALIILIGPEGLLVAWKVVFEIISSVSGSPQSQLIFQTFQLHLSVVSINQPSLKRITKLVSVSRTFQISDVPVFTVWRVAKVFISPLSSLSPIWSFFQEPSLGMTLLSTVLLWKFLWTAIKIPMIF